MTSKKIYVVSDLHMGDGGSRDNFSIGDRPKLFSSFLDHVAEEGAELYILGDLFEFWQSSLSSVVMNSKPLLDKMASMDVTYVYGNHDSDLSEFIDTEMLGHPFFERMTAPIEQEIGGKKIRFQHGHEVDPFNKCSAPSWGRMLAIFAGIFEDKNGSPVLTNGESVEEVLEGFGENLLRLWNWLANKFKKKVSKGESPSPKKELTPAQNPDRAKEMLGLLKKDKEERAHDITIAGHTHQPGVYEDWHYNCGSWVGERNDFLIISETGEVSYHYWTGKVEDVEMPQLS